MSTCILYTFNVHISLLIILAVNCSALLFMHIIVTRKPPSRDRTDHFSNIVADREFSTGCYLFTYLCLPLLIFPCTIKSRSSLLAPAHTGGPEKRVAKRLWCVCGCCLFTISNSGLLSAQRLLPSPTHPSPTHSRRLIARRL